ncbi:MAG: fibronectin type III domain-containing protein, partial [Micrococcales bacterium]
PGKGLTWQYRVTARTAFGESDVSAAASVSVATTVTSIPLIRSFVANQDGTLTVTWLAPYDLGGTPLTGYIIERSADNVNWTALPAAAANVLTVSMPGGGPGVRSFVRVKATNAVGISAASTVLTTMVPYQLASAPTGLTVSLVSGRAALTWAAPATTGGAPITQYSIEYSANGGANWAIAAYSSSTSANVGVAPKGQTLSYRVAARNAAGFSTYSNVVALTTPSTVTSSVRLNSAVSTGVGSFNLTFSSPIDLGGYATYNYRVDVLVNNVWTAVATGAGNAVNVVSIRTPSSNLIYSYRVITTNPSGDSAPATFNYRA